MSAIKPLTQSTDTEYSCTHCGSTVYSVVRPDSANPRLKCSSCNFVYNGKDSLAADSKGEIPVSSPKTLAAANEPDREIAPDRVDKGAAPFYTPAHTSSTDVSIPRTPKFVFLSKPREKHAFATAKNVKSVALRWEAEGLSYDVYELTPKKFEVNINIE